MSVRLAVPTAPLLGLLLACGCGKAAPPAATDTGVLAICEGEAGMVRPPRQLRLLTRAEYADTVRDLFGWARGELAEAGRTCTEELDCDVRSETCEEGSCMALACDEVGFTLADGGYGEVVLAGEMNGWAATEAEGGWPLELDEGAGTWWARFALDEGSYQYKLVADGSTWVTDPVNPDTTDDGYGGVNSVLTVDCAGELAGVSDAIDALAEDLPVESRPDGTAFSNAASAGVVTDAHVQQSFAAGAAIAELALADQAGWLDCNGLDDAGCAEHFVDGWLPRAFRRPPTEDESARYLALVTGEETLEEGLALGVMAALSSPSFLYREEVGLPGASGFYELDAWERASALSYFLWGTMPDTLLFEAAANGALDSEGGLRTQALRMLEDDRARERLGVFARQWLGAEDVLTVDKSDGRYPGFGTAERRGLHDETGAAFVYLALDAGGTVPELFTSSTTVGDAAVAELYGVSGPAGEGAGLLDLSGTGRAGVLGQGAVLATHAHSDQTSPVRRGVWVRERLLCQELPAPPADAGGVPDVDEDSTTRDRFEQHSADPYCASCHQFLDPVGFGFEHFDAVGAWRDTELGEPVDASGSLDGVEDMYDGSEQPYLGLEELGLHLAESQRAPACVALQVRRFAVGSTPDEEELCAVGDLAARAADEGWRLDALILAVVQDPSFWSREGSR